MSKVTERPKFQEKYDNFIGGKFVPPVKGEYFDNISPIDGKAFTKQKMEHLVLQFAVLQ